jgi:hypothetical protein
LFCCCCRPQIAKEAEVHEGPLSLLREAMKGGIQVLVSLRGGHQLLGRVKAYDRVRPAKKKKKKKKKKSFEKGKNRGGRLVFVFAVHVGNCLFKK